MRSTIRGTAVMLAALILVACGGGGGGHSTGPSNAPVISNLRQIALTPNSLGTPHVFGVDYQDQGGDIRQGVCEITIRGNTSTSQLTFAPGSTAETGSVVCNSQLQRTTPTPVTVSVTVLLIDGSGHRSNTLTITATLETTTL